MSFDPLEYAWKRHEEMFQALITISKERAAALNKLYALQAKIDCAEIEEVSRDAEGVPVIWDPFNCRPGDRVRVIRVTEDEA